MALGGPTTRTWGLYLNNAPAIVAESCVSMELRAEYVVADFQIESGAFNSYDKVWRPNIIRMRLAQGESDQARQTFLDSLEAIITDTQLYDAVTPEKTYTGVNVTRYEYRRTASEGTSLIVAELILTQILTGVTPQYSNVRTPSAADPVSTGTVQTQGLSSQQQSAVNASPDLNPFL